MGADESDVMSGLGIWSERMGGLAYSVLAGQTGSVTGQGRSAVLMLHKVQFLGPVPLCTWHAAAPVQ